MPPAEPSRVFISYARKDGAALAQRLQSDLAKQGFDAWLDTGRIAGGAVWSTEIEREIDTRQRHALRKPRLDILLYNQFRDLGNQRRSRFVGSSLG
jgi:hypothetical protein